MISDVEATAEMPDQLRQQAAMRTGCIAGAEHVDRIKELSMEAGFLDVKIELKTYSKKLISGWFPGSRAEDDVASADIHAVKTCCWVRKRP